MSDPPSEERLAAALQEYQATLDAGLPVDRDELLRRFPDVPGLADDLNALDALRGVERDFHFDDTSEPRLDDFEILGEVGRGGMGVVYEARHRSLDRRVAIKVLTHAAGMDAIARQRFLHEARVAALIDHPNVVPVFQVGEADGTPFYVMPFIEGESLAAAIRRGGFTSRSFAIVAGIGQQAAEALAAAHAKGIVHRDIKPGNLLLDLQGKAWIVDFGLAAAPFADGLTRTGSRLGTPRYMSPEQISGPRDRVDSRTDVYSLGVTLYELLTSQPAFAGDSETDLIRRIVNSEPMRPRRIRPSIPQDLETIVLKASAKDPAERYQAAQDLADDLRRFLDGRPVLARRPGLGVKITKWLRRNRRPVALTTGTLVAGALLGLGTSTVAVWRAYQSERTARTEADRNRQVALSALSNLSTVSGDILSHTPGLRDRQLAVLRQWRDSLEPIADDPNLPRKVRRDIARVNFDLGVIQARAGHLADAAESYRTAATRLEKLAAVEPDDPRLQVDLADAYQALASVLSSTGRFAESEAMLAAALPHAERGQRSLPDEAQPLVNLTMIRCALGEADFRRTGVPENTLREQLDALKVYERLRDRYRTEHPLSYMRLAGGWISVAGLYERIGQMTDLERALRRALEYDEHLARAFADQPATVRDGTRSARAALGLCLIRQGRADEGEPLFDDGIRDLEQAARNFPDDVGNRSELAVFHFKLAHFRHQQGRTDAARALGRRCLELTRAAPPGFSKEFRVQALVLLPSPDLRDPAAAARVLAEGEGFVNNWVRAAVLWRSGRPAEALSLASDDSERAGGFIRAACLAQLGRVDEARQAYDEAVHRPPAPAVCRLEVISLQREVAAILEATPPQRP